VHVQRVKSAFVVTLSVCAWSFVATASAQSSTGAGGADASGPTVTAPYFPFASPAPLSSLVSQTVRWSASDPLGICGTDLEESIDGAAFVPIELPSATATSIVREHAMDPNGEHVHRYRYRVRATNCAGQTSAYKTSWAFAPYVYDGESDGPVLYDDFWGSSSVDGDDYILDTFDWSTTPGATATFPTLNTGTPHIRRVAWVAARGPDRGVANVIVDGTQVATVKLKASALMPRRVVWQKAWRTAGPHTVKIQVVSGLVDVDAIEVLF
jgi:hypothetical protein